MKVRIETYTRPDRVVVEFDDERTGVVVSTSAPTVSEAVASAMNRFGEMQNEAAAELAKIGIRLSHAPDEEMS